MSCVSPLGEDPQKLVPGVPPNSAHVPFPFADGAWYALAIINQSHEYNHMLSPLSPPNGLLNLRITKPLTHTPILDFQAKRGTPKPLLLGRLTD